jgi:hypothetical protein
MNVKKDKGIGLVEVVIVSGLVLVIFSGLASVFNFYIKKSVSLTDNIKAEFLATEGLEALRTIRDSSYASLGTLPRDTDRYLYWNGAVWVATTTPELVDGIFERRFRIFDVYRNVSGDIAVSGTLDANILKTEVEVSWMDSATTSKRVISNYLGNVFEI